MAGSYRHCITDSGQLRRDSLLELIENYGDFYEAIEEMFGMIWWLAAGVERGRGGDAADWVRLAAQNYKIGLDQSPGIEGQP